MKQTYLHFNVILIKQEIFYSLFIDGKRKLLYPEVNNLRYLSNLSNLSSLSSLQSVPSMVSCPGLCPPPAAYPPYSLSPMAPLLPSWCLHTLLLQSQANLLHQLQLQAAHSGIQVYTVKSW